ncbi:MAG: polysaccharide biosynthesis/export family protein [Deltaproteobacteria bacterium]|nr:polysaccharide biosynthesis/export family protein [Deltaproteobacteria bacterium]
MKNAVVKRVGLALALVVMMGCGRARSTPPVPLPALDASAPEAKTASEYLIQPGDTLRVKFLYHPDLDVRLPVRPDGNISLQMTGDIAAAGMSANHLAEVIRERSGDRLRDPEVTVIVAEIGEQKVYVGGEVRLPGFVPYRSGLTPLQAILDRGGFTDTARADSVVHLMVGEKDYQATRLDLTKVLEGEPESVQLAARDMLYVPRTTIGDMNSFVDLYVRRLLPIPPRVGVGFSP